MKELQNFELQTEQLAEEISQKEKECDAKKVDDKARELRFNTVKLSEEIEGKGWALKALKAMNEQREKSSK